MINTRNILFIILLGIGFLLFGILYREGKKTAFDSSLAPFFQILGKPIQKTNKALSKVLPIDSIDENEYGLAIRERYKDLENTGGTDQDRLYLNSILKNLTEKKKKPFEYKIYILDSYIPNAFAMPGGVLFITKGLLEILKSESELIAILGHEMGHVEKNHCFDRVRFELLSKKIGLESLGKIADLVFTFVVSTSYNKTQEDEADEYAYQLLLDSKYDPAGEGRAFHRLKESYQNMETRKANLVSEYFLSHPYTELREEKFSEKAKSWWILHRNDSRYIGKQNFIDRVNILLNEYSEEWISEYQIE